MRQSIIVSKLFIFAFLATFLPPALNAHPMFLHSLQASNASPKHRHHREMFKLSRQNEQREMAIIEAALEGEEGRKENEGMEGNNDELTGEEGTLAQRMRINTGQWAWSEAHSVREEVYLFAFTYFGMVTILMICLLILVSCCYMYDCMGCYDPFWKQSPKGGNTSSIAPFGGNGQMVVIGQKATGGWGWGKKAQGRRWSLV